MPGPPADVERIVGEVREEIARRRAAGDLTLEDIEWLLDGRLRASIARGKIDEKLAARFLHESHDWNIDAGYEIRTQRPGVSGALIRGAKFLIRPVVRLYTDHILKRQTQINLALWHVLRDTVERNVAQELELRRLRKEIDALKERG